MSRSYKAVRPKGHRVYSVDDLMKLYNVSRNTVTNWINAGLTTSDRARPYIFRGAVVKRFHEARRQRFKTSLGVGEFKCLCCKAAVLPSKGAIEKHQTERGGTLLFSTCPDCDAVIRKFASQADLAYLAGTLIPNTSGDSAHEENSAAPVGIVNSPTESVAPIWQRNDRTVFAWQHYAARYSEKTQDRHLAAIRQFEGFLGGKSFSRLTLEDVSGFRDHLRNALSIGRDARQAKSTIAHSLSHVRDFLTWLIKQKSFERLLRDLPDYLYLSRAEYADALPRPRRNYPQIEGAEAMLMAMPDRTLLQRRNRAIFATAFLGALRADTLVSLRIGHVLTAEKVIVQDGSVSRTKNGKSLRVHWFPIPETFKHELIRWLEDLATLGARSDDALFPPGTWLCASPRGRTRAPRPVLPMTSTHAVSEAFRTASGATEQPYTPHAAKHTIAALRGTLLLTEVQRKAWSQNMGHETERITETHYGKLSDERCDEIFEEMTNGATGPASGTLSAEELCEIKSVAKTMLSILQLHGVTLKD